MKTEILNILKIIKIIIKVVYMIDFFLNTTKIDRLKRNEIIKIEKNFEFGLDIMKIEIFSILKIIIIEN
jgi:hypothetical protein